MKMRLRGDRKSVSQVGGAQKKSRLKVTSYESNLSADFSTMRNAFGIDNAKQLQTIEAVRYFVPQPAFAGLFVAKNHILLGSRGSGKTTWVRMMAHDHVMLASKDAGSRTNYARDALSRNLIGIYVPASAAFAGDLKNKPWQTESEAEEYFVWRLNLHSCSALTHIIESCVDQYVAADGLRHQAQADICRELATIWGGEGSKATTPAGLRLILSSMEIKHQSELRKRLTSSQEIDPYLDHFDTELFLPLRHAMHVLKVGLNIPSTAVWMVCLDEVEYLTELHHRILNTQLRSASGDLVFKIATMPFAHHTLATNLGDPVREGNDFEYVHVDQEPIDSRGSQSEGEFLRFARELFKQRIAFQSPHLIGLTLRDLLGASPLLEDKRIESGQEKEAFMSLLRRHANPATIARAERLQSTLKFKSEIVRKMHGALILRDAIENSHGNTRMKIYSGESLVVRCADGNGRRLMRILNSLVQRLEVNDGGRAKLPIDAGVQNDVLESIARETMNRISSEPPYGNLTARYLKAIGAYMKWTFSSANRRLGTDQTTSVTISAEDGEDAQHFIKQAIQLSLMIPARNVPMKTPDQTCVGDFHLAFLFSPFFRILPRRNEAVRLPKVLSHIQSNLSSSQAGGGAQRSLLENI